MADLIGQGDMQDATRTCADCKMDISARHANSKRCHECAANAAKNVERDRDRRRPPRSQRPKARQLKPTAGCRVCTAVFTINRAGQVTCSNRCGQYLRRHPDFVFARRACRTCGASIDEGHRARKYCSAACQPRTKTDGRVVEPLVTRHRTIACGHCGRTFSTTRKTIKFCSRKCESREYASPGSYRARMGRTCEHCGAALSVDERVNRRHCSDRCTVLANQLVRRARRRGLPVERIDRIAVFERDQWTCHICRRPVDPEVNDGPMQANLDHIIPYAEPGCPGHVWQNLALAHRCCNIGKNGRTRPEDWALYRKLGARRRQWQQTPIPVMEPPPG